MSTFSVTFPLVPPPVRSVPAVTPVIVPVPGNFCPVAKVIRPLLLIDSPVSVGTELPEANSRLKLPDGDEVLFPAGSACQRKC